MNKLAIILDTFSARNESWNEKHDHFYYLPLQLELNGKNYKLGLNDGPDMKTISDMINKAKTIKTSMPTPNDVIELFEKLSKEYENVFYLSIGSPVSGTSKAAKVFAKDFKNVHVLNNLLVGLQFELLGKKLLEMTSKGKAFNDVIKYAETYIENSKSTYIVPKDVTPFIKSGRLGRALGLLLNKVKAVPVVAYDNYDHLTKKMIKRSPKKAVIYAIEKMIDNVLKSKGKLEVLITYGTDEELKDLAVAELKKANIVPITEPASPLSMANTGSGAISISAIEKI